MRDRLPRRWHRLDARCGCAACEAGRPRSPYRKVLPGPRYRPLLKNGAGFAVCAALAVLLSQLWGHGVLPMTLPIAVVLLACVVGALWFALAYISTATAIMAARATAARRNRGAG